MHLVKARVIAVASKGDAVSELASRSSAKVTCVVCARDPKVTLGMGYSRISRRSRSVRAHVGREMTFVCVRAASEFAYGD